MNAAGFLSQGHAVVVNATLCFRHGASGSLTAGALSPTNSIHASITQVSVRHVGLLHLAAPPWSNVMLLRFRAESELFQDQPGTLVNDGPFLIDGRILTILGFDYLALMRYTG